MVLLLACQDVGLVAPGEEDLDEDGFHASSDCDDADPDVWPGAPEVADDGVDQDCDGVDSRTLYGHDQDTGSQIYVAEFLMGTTFDVLAPLEVTHLGTVVFDAMGEGRLALYADNAGRPDALLLATADTDLVDGQNEWPVTPTVIEPGTYWVHFLTDSDVKVGAGPVGPITYRDYLWDDGLPDPFGPATDYEDARFSGWVRGQLP